MYRGGWCWKLPVRFGIDRPTGFGICLAKGDISCVAAKANNETPSLHLAASKILKSSSMLSTDAPLKLVASDTYEPINLEVHSRVFELKIACPLLTKVAWFGERVRRAILLFRRKL